MNSKKLGIEFLKLLAGILFLILISCFLFKNPLLSYNNLFILIGVPAMELWEYLIKIEKILKKPHTLSKRIIKNLVYAVFLIITMRILNGSSFSSFRSDVILMLLFLIIAFFDKDKEKVTSW